MALLLVAVDDFDDRSGLLLVGALGLHVVCCVAALDEVSLGWNTPLSQSEWLACSECGLLDTSDSLGAGHLLLGLVCV